MKTVGQVLRDARHARKMSVAAIASATRIPEEHIHHLEQGAYDKLPPSPFVKGFIRNYAKLVDLEVLPLYALYRREVDEEDQTKKQTQRGPTPLPTYSFRLTVPSLLVTGAVIILISFFGYLLYAYQSFAGAPLLLVTGPNDQARITSETVTISGKVDPAATLTVNAQEVVIGRNGQFLTEIHLPIGVTELVIRAVNERGKETIVRRIVVRE